MSTNPAAESSVEPNSRPENEYSGRLNNRRELLARKSRRFGLIAHLRVAVFGLLVVLTWLVLNDPMARWLPALIFVMFVSLVVWHAHISRQCQLYARAAEYYVTRLACLNGEWVRFSRKGERYLEEDHPCTLDLDVFGQASLFQLLCTARTRMGEDRLADWLKSSAPLDRIRDRQVAVRDLVPRLDLREHLALLAGDVPPGVNLAPLEHWAQADVHQLPAWMLLPALAVVAWSVAMLLAWVSGSASGLPFVLALLIQAALAVALRNRTREVLLAVENRANDLVLFAGLLNKIESEQFAATSLRDLQASLNQSGKPPSRAIAELAALVDWLNARRNLIFAPLALLFLWQTQLAIAIAAWRRRHGSKIGGWMSAVAEFEALCSLATYAYENPLDSFPKLLDEGPCFDAVELGHPLMPRNRCITNDVHLDRTARLLVVSGSNMSGKSTLLRSVGINTILALAGAPTRARQLRVSAFAVGATLRIQDSLQAGKSRFYAEITRLRQLIDLARGPRPLLFLLDEILHGTNSHDRRIGAEAIVRTLVEAGAVGLVTTHDLALTHLADLLKEHAANVHFADEIVDGKIIFDYKMKPGVVQNSNALALMRAVGIQV